MTRALALNVTERRATSLLGGAERTVDGLRSASEENMAVDEDGDEELTWSHRMVKALTSIGEIILW